MISNIPPVSSMRDPGQGEAVGLVSVVVPLCGDDDVLALVVGPDLLVLTALRCRHRSGQVVKALVRLALSVAEAELVVGLPGVGVGEGVHAAAGAGAVHEGTFQQVNWSHRQTALLKSRNYFDIFRKIRKLQTNKILLSLIRF